jgi:acyl-CoA thioester hydrolase
VNHPFRFSHRLRVRWGECDMQGIVFNPHYMLYFDVAFTEYWRTIGMTYPDALVAEGVDNFMVAADLRYRDAGRFDDELDIFVRTEYLGTTSFRMAFCIRRGETVLVEGTGTYVVGDRVTRAPRPLPARLIKSVMEFETTPPTQKTIPA